MAAVPHYPSPYYLFVNQLLNGLAQGGMETGQMVWMIELWGDKAPAALQGQQFSYACGMLLSPLMVKPFLREGFNETEYESCESRNISDVSKCQLSESRVYVPFAISSATGFIAAFLLTVLYFYQTYEPPKKETSESKETITSTNRGYRIRVIIMGAFLIASYVGIEVLNFNLLPTFAHYCDLKLSDPDAAFLHSFFAIAYTVGRAISIFLAFRVRPHIMLYINFLLIAAGNFVILFGGSNNLTALWIGVIILGWQQI